MADEIGGVEDSYKNLLYLVLSSAMGLGLSPYFPGTCGALLGVAFHILIVLLLPISVQWYALVTVFLLVCIVNHQLTPWAERYWQAPDPKHFVLDEVAGYLFIPILYRGGPLLFTAVYGFLIFRVLDIFKLIPPAGWVDKNIHGSWGILLDDLVSGAYAAMILYGVHRFFPMGSP